MVDFDGRTRERLSRLRSGSDWTVLLRIDVTTVACRLGLQEVYPGVGAGENNRHGLKRRHIEIVTFFQPQRAIQRNRCHDRWCQKETGMTGVVLAGRDLYMELS
jgi:hypothetical protein